MNAAALPGFMTCAIASQSLDSSCGTRRVKTSSPSCLIWLPTLATSTRFPRTIISTSRPNCAKRLIGAFMNMRSGSSLTEVFGEY